MSVCMTDHFLFSIKVFFFFWKTHFLLSMHLCISRCFRAYHGWEQSWFLPMDYKPQRLGVLAQSNRRSKILVEFFLKFQEASLVPSSFKFPTSPEFWESVSKMSKLLQFWEIWVQLSEEIGRGNFLGWPS